MMDHKSLEYVSALRARATLLKSGALPTAPEYLQGAFLEDAAKWCEDNNARSTRLAAQLGISDNTAQSWKSGRTPAVSHLDLYRARLEGAPVTVPARLSFIVRHKVAEKNAKVFLYSPEQAAEYATELDTGREPALTPQYFCWLLDEWLQCTQRTPAKMAAVLEVSASALHAWKNGRVTPVRIIEGLSEERTNAVLAEVRLHIERIWADIEGAASAA